MKKRFKNLKSENGNKVQSAKDCAYLAVFVAVVIALQVALSPIPGIELTTVMFTAYSFTQSVKQGIFAATAFSLLRQIVFGFFPVVLILYLVYYNLLAFTFATLGKRIKNPLKALPLLAVIACVCTACFTLLDNLLTPLWYGYSAQAAKLYFYASLPFMIPQIISSAVSVALLFLPLRQVFQRLK